MEDEMILSSVPIDELDENELEVMEYQLIQLLYLKKN